MKNMPPVTHGEEELCKS